MNIKPSSPQGPRNPADAAALESARTAEARKPETNPAKNAVGDRHEKRPDSVDVSAEAKALAEQQEARAAGSLIAPDRLKQISERLESGFYDQPAVIDQVARRVARDPGFVGPE